MTLNRRMKKKSKIILLWILIVQIVFFYILIFHNDVILHVGDRYSKEQWEFLFYEHDFTPFEDTISGLCFSFNIIGSIANLILCAFTIQKYGGLVKIPKVKILMMIALGVAYGIIWYLFYYSFEWVYLPTELLTVEFTSLLLLLL